jgi:hypothetical protein
MLNRRILMVGVRGFEPPTSASQTLRAKPTALHPALTQYIKETLSGQTETWKKVDINLLFYWGIFGYYTPIYEFQPGFDIHSRLSPFSA